jgi:hypothetical protein
LANLYPTANAYASVLSYVMSIDKKGRALYTCVRWG